MEKGRRRLLAGMLLLSPLVVNAWNHVTISGFQDSKTGGKYACQTFKANEAAFDLRNRYTMGIGVPFHEVSPAVFPKFAELSGNKMDSIGTALIPGVPCFYNVNSVLSENYAESLKVFDLVCPIMASIDVSDPKETVKMDERGKDVKKVIRRINIYRSVENEELYFSPIGAFLGKNYKESWSNWKSSEGASHDYTLSCFYGFPANALPKINATTNHQSIKNWNNPGEIKEINDGEASFYNLNGKIKYEIAPAEGTYVTKIDKGMGFSGRAIALQKTQKKGQGFAKGAVSIPWTATQCYNKDTVSKPYCGQYGDYGLFGMKLTAMNQVLVTRVVAGDCVELTYHCFPDSEASSALHQAFFKDCNTRRFGAYLQDDDEINTPENQDRLGIYWKLNELELNDEAANLCNNIKALLENYFDEKLDENQSRAFHSGEDPVRGAPKKTATPIKKTADDEYSENEEVDLSEDSSSHESRKEGTEYDPYSDESQSLSMRNSLDSYYDYYSEPPVKSAPKRKITPKDDDDEYDESSSKGQPAKKTGNKNQNKPVDLGPNNMQTNTNQNNDASKNRPESQSRVRIPRYTKKLTGDDLKDLEAREKLFARVAEMRQKERSARASRQASQQSSVQTSAQESDIEDTISTSVKHNQAPGEVKKPARRGGLTPATPKRRMQNRWQHQKTSI